MQGTDILIFLLVLVLSIDVHEFAHAWSATVLGDTTAKRAGRLSLNPIVHLDPMGTVMILLASLTGFGIGWGKPVPVNPYNLRTTPVVGMGLVAAAGPISNFIMAFAASLLFSTIAGSVPTLALRFLLIFVIVNIGLGVFNLIPLFPLDGYRILMGVLGALRTRWAGQAALWWGRQEQWGPLLLLGIVLLNSYIPIFSMVMGPPTQFLRRLMLGF